MNTCCCFSRLLLIIVLVLQEEAITHSIVKEPVGTPQTGFFAIYNIFVKVAL